MHCACLRRHAERRVSSPDHVRSTAGAPCLHGTPYLHAVLWTRLLLTLHPSHHPNLRSTRS